MVPMPPMVSHRELAAWRRPLGRDPSFSQTLKLTNTFWCRTAVPEVQKSLAVRLISLGEDIFLERMAEPYRFETKVVAKARSRARAPAEDRRSTPDA